MTSLDTIQPLERLQRLCAGLCHDAGVTVVSGEGLNWAWHPKSGVITVPESDLTERGPEYCSGVLSHEVGHVFLSRTHQFVTRHTSHEKLRFLFLNGIEDPRVNSWILQRYPGATAWHREMARVDLQGISAPLLPSLQFGFECAKEQYLDWQSSEVLGPVPPLVSAALDETRADRIRYAQFLPPSDLRATATAEELGKRLRRSLSGLAGMRSFRLPATAWEREVLLQQLEAIQFAALRIVPAFERLLAHDIAALGEYLCQSSAARTTALRLLRQDKRVTKPEMVSFFQTVCDQTNLARICPEPKPAIREICMDLIWLLANGPNLQTGRHVKGSFSSAGSGSGSSLPDPGTGDLADPECWWMDTGFQLSRRPSARNYAEVLNRLRPQILSLCRELDELLQPRRRMAERAGHATGGRVDIRKLLAFEADPRRYRELWRKKTLPDRRSLAVSLLVDLSGSMELEGKAEAAFAGTVLLANVLARQEVSFAINGFQDALIPFHRFRAAFTPGSGKNLEEMFEEVSGGRQGGRNRPDTNADGPCLRQAADELAAQPEADRLLIVISDGLPSAPEPNPEDDLRAAISAISKPDSRIRLVGLGLGTETEHVCHFYPAGKACIPEPQLASEIAALIRSALLGTSIPPMPSSPKVQLSEDSLWENPF